MQESLVNSSFNKALISRQVPSGLIAQDSSEITFNLTFTVTLSVLDFWFLFLRACVNLDNNRTNMLESMFKT